MSGNVVKGKRVTHLLSKGLPSDLILLDCETTGGKASFDRITELALIEIHQGEVVDRWQTLINPETGIPDWIANFTGITNQMVATAPHFSAIAADLYRRLENKVLVAHNARFDYGFLKHEFKRAGIDYNAKTLCTVKLSKALYPQYQRHGLDAVVERLGLSIGQRHRAMTDTEILWQLLQVISQEFSPDIIEAASKGLLKHTTLPLQIDKSQIENLPTGPGVYYFFDNAKNLLYIGKSVNLRERVLSHFSADHRNQADLIINQTLASLHVDETLSDFGAQLLENVQIKKLSPHLNRRQRKNRTLYQFILATDEEGFQHIQLISVDVYQTPSRQQRYGLFRNRKQAEHQLEKLINANQLCRRFCGLGKKSQGACFAYQVHQCAGACCGKESPERYNLRVAIALHRLKLEIWPWETALVVIENPKDPDIDSLHYHVIDDWIYLGRAVDYDDIDNLLNQQQRHPQPFDIDAYRILVKFLLNPALQRKNRLQLQPYACNASNQ